MVMVTDLPLGEKPAGVGKAPVTVPKLIVSVPSPTGAFLSATGAEATVCRWASCCTSIVVEMLVGSPVPDALAATVALSLLTVWRPSEPLETSALSAVEKEERSEEHTTETQSLMRLSYAVLCLKQKNHTK